MPFLLAVVATLACAAPASADTLTTILQDYVNDQRIDACRYSEKELRQLKDLIPNDANAYAADFAAAVDDALASRARGGCNKAKAQQAQGTQAAPATGGGTGSTQPPAASGGTGTGAPASGTAAPSTPNAVKPPPTPTALPTAAPEIVAIRDAITVAARTTDPATDAPFPVLALAILAGLFALSGLVVAAARWLGWEPAWADNVRHAASEAGWRASSTWSEFTDFVRFGR